MTKRQAPTFILGYGADGKTPVINGGYILYMKDSKGLSIDTSIGVLAEKGMTFDVVSYFAACNLNPNYGMDASLNMLKNATKSEHHERFEAALRYFLLHKEKYLQKYQNQSWNLL